MLEKKPTKENRNPNISFQDLAGVFVAAIMLREISLYTGNLLMMLCALAGLYKIAFALKNNVIGVNAFWPAPPVKATIPATNAVVPSLT